jgi:phospholipase/carboxylesterase
VHSKPELASERAAKQGRLLARPLTDKKRLIEASKGLLKLGLGQRRDAQLYVPASYHPDHAMPFVLTLHGAGGNAEHGTNLLRDMAETHGLILLAPDSRGRTWDMILNTYGPDVEFIDQALEHAFERYNIDRAHLAVGGFSDGASYALSLGIINGDLFTHVLAFAPGFMAPTMQNGVPRLFISHGTKDGVLPIDKCSRRLVPQARYAGYEVLYQEFDGPHIVPPEIARQATQWFLAEPARAKE